MAASGGLISESTDVSQWLKNLPLAPEYHPTLAEFQDPIAYIFKIEKEAASYGICKIVPPVLSAPRKTAIANLNRSLVARSGSKSQPTFTTRQQQIGFCPRKPRPVKKSVWQSGEYYTFQEFEAKAKAFEKNYLKKCSKKAALSPLEIETLYWKATVDKPFSVEYANDMPGSAFAPMKSGGKEMGEGVTVGETEWNMRGVSRAKGSLLRFMKEEIPGVTSPMVYIAMMFSWFAWHVEDHDLHSLNYLHMGAGKTWYGVPREAAAAFEDVVRVHGYGEESNPLVTFHLLGEKTTIMSPEVFVSAGVPCCRLVQNAGEFVVTFPRAYHSGFSHGFNCGEAANIATPEWLKVAKDAAIRRASINCPPMVSHFQLLYDLAHELCTRIPMSIAPKPRSSRLKDKQKGEGDTLVKQIFVENMVHNNNLLHKLGKGSSVVLLPQSSSDISVCSNLRVGSQLRVSHSVEFCRNKGIMKSSDSSVPYETKPEEISQTEGLFSSKSKFASQYDRSVDKLSDQRLFSCVTCGILSFDCIAIVQPSEAAARYLMSADCSFFNDWVVGSEQNPYSRSVENNARDSLDDVTDCGIQSKGALVTKSPGDTSALSLLASNYAESSDSEDETAKAVVLYNDGENNTGLWSTESKCHSFKQECHNVVTPFSQKMDEDSSRVHVFCLEHAVEVEQRFSQIGGVHILLLSHREYPKIEAEAKLASEELGIDCFWNNITFRDATKEDGENIQLAFDSEDSSPGNGDWAVKLGINLFYSANLSRSPLYIKQMPYNSVIYNAFGYSSPASSPDGRRSGRQRKVVAGRWCGKVWMSNQVHPFLVKRDTEDWDFENEQDRSFDDRRVLLHQKFERKPKNNCNMKATSRKRKNTLLSGLSKKVKSRVAADVASEDSEEGVSHKQDIRVYSRKQRKHNQIEALGDSLKDMRHVDREYEASDNSLGGNFRSRNGSLLRRKPAKYEGDTDNDVSNDFVENYSRKQKKRFSGTKSKQAKYVGRGSEISGDSDGDIHDQVRSFPQRTQGEFFEANSEDSVERSSLQHSPRISGGSEADYIEREDEVSDENMYSQHSGSQRSGDFEVSDDSLENSGWQQSRALKGKQAKFIEREDAVSDDLLSNILYQPRVPRSKRTKFVGSEDAISDEFAGDDACLKRFRNPRIKGKWQIRNISGKKQVQRKYISNDLRDIYWRRPTKSCRRLPVRPNEEDNVSDEMLESDEMQDDENSLLHSGKLPRAKEDSGSEDSMEDDSSKNQKRNLRSKQRKIVPKTKPQLNKKGAKQEKQMKQDPEGGPSTRLRKRPSKQQKEVEPKPKDKKMKSTSSVMNPKSKQEDLEYQCDIEGCTMSFGSKQELSIHKRNICPVKGCGKTFFSHKYLVQHRRVHSDDRPLKCPWKGCKMTFKWAWARTEHIRVHTGARPYVCAEEGCGQTFRFVSDFSRHKRKTGHSVKKTRV